MLAGTGDPAATAIADVFLEIYATARGTTGLALHASRHAHALVAGCA